jgi:nucleoside-diphosphate-sugar epimerase
MAVLVTGASGFVGSALLPLLLKKGHTVYALSRHPPAPAKNIIPVEGNILHQNLGFDKGPRLSTGRKIHAVYHLAAIHRLGENQAEEIWETNVSGTANVIEFCKKHEIPCLVFISSAYTQGRNPYERSKACCEWMVRNSGIPKVTILKPSIIMGTPQHFYPGHVSQFIALLVKVHERAEIVRRKIEGSLRLPVLEPVFRLKANPEGKINLISIEDVAKAIIEIDKPGTFWLTHPFPPTIGQLVEWVSEFIMVKIEIKPIFEPSAIEAMFQKMSKAFEPYLWGDNFPSDLIEAQPITRDLIRDTIKMTLLG